MSAWTGRMSVSRRTLILLVVVAAPAIAPATAHARHVNEVSQGDFFHVGDDAPGKNLMGSAKVTRFDDDTTSLQVHVHGLRPGAKYGVHLHAGACADHGPHYRNEPDGPARPPTELWASSDRDDATAGITADENGNASGMGTAPWRARAEARSVFIHSPGKGHTAIGCADLSGHALSLPVALVLASVVRLAVRSGIG